MDRKFYLDLAAGGLRMPIGTHLVLHRHAETVGMHPEKLFQGIALELNLDPTPMPE